MRQEILSLQPKADLNRRAFVSGATVLTGFALAAGPVNAQSVIVTDAVGLAAGTGQVPVAGGSIPAYYARPAAGGPFPIVLVGHEAFGVHEHIKDICRRLAKIGYLAVAPDLFFRQGDPSKAADIPAMFRDIVSKVADAQVMGDLDATAVWAAAEGRGDPNRLAFTGFCWGGRIAWLYAAHSSRLRAGVAWYGRLSGDYGALTPRHPVDVAKELKAPVLGLYGGADQGIPVSTIEDMQAELETAKKPSEFIVYPDAPHAFHADFRSSYREEPAKDAWNKMQAWFKKHGV